MLARFRAAGLLLPTISALAALAVLLGLGTWQLARKAWKDDLQRRIEARIRAGPVPLADVLARPREPADLEYLRVRVRGRYLHERELHLQALEGGRLGWNVITPVETRAGDLVFINRGFVPGELKLRESRPQSLIEGEAEFNGLIRVPPTSKGWFVPENDPSRNRWYWLDLAEMRRSLDAGKTVAPFVVASEPVHVPVPPAGGATRLTMPSRHLEYALTWYGLAATLIAVYFAFARGRLRASLDHRD